MIIQNDKQRIKWYPLEEIKWYLESKIWNIIRHCKRSSGTQKSKIWHIIFLGCVECSTVYSFIDGFSSYHQIIIVKEDRHKTTFATEWGSFQYIVMPFVLKNVPTIFSRVVVEAFKDFLHKLLEAYFDDWTVFSLIKDHIECLRIMLDKCR
jgi:hypothetical protein